MPMEADELAEMQALIQVARKRDLNFAVCMGKKPEGTIFYMHRKKDYGILARNAKKAGDTAKLAFGTCTVKGKKILMTCMEDPPPAMARQMKGFLKENGLPFKVSVLDRFGGELDSDGEDDEDDIETGASAGPGDDEAVDAKTDTSQDEAVDEKTDTSQENAADELAKRWSGIVAQMGPLYTKAMATNPPNRTQLEAAWAMADEKAEGGDYKTAIAIAGKIRPALLALAETAQEDAPQVDPLAAQWEKVRPETEALVLKALNTNPPNRTQIEAAWAMAVEKAEGGDYKTSLAIVNKLKPTLTALSETSGDDAKTDNPQAAEWAKREADMSVLYTEAMKSNPPEASKMQAAWAMATEKAEAGDYATALKVADRLQPLLEQAANAGGGAEPKTNIVAFQRSRIQWIDTRRAMMTEMKKLEDAITAVCNANPDLAPVAAEVSSLSDRLNVFDTRLDDILEEITVTPDGDKREALKKDAAAAIAEYRNALNSDFFKDVDGGNGFTNVNVAAAANDSLATIAKALAG